MDPKKKRKSLNREKSLITFLAELISEFFQQAENQLKKHIINIHFESLFCFSH